MSDAALTEFLGRNGIGPADLAQLTSDASPRRYYRVSGKAILLMQDATDPVGYAAYLRLSPHLAGLGLSAPGILATDPAHGLALIEDFGDATYAAELTAGTDERDLYELAIDALAHLHAAPGATGTAQPPYALDTYLDELDLFADWFAPAAGMAEAAAFKVEWRGLWREALRDVAARRDALVLKDFHVDNLMLLRDRTGVARCGLLDFQDALLGPREYDLVSLLQDARRDLSLGLEEEMLERYIARSGAGTGTRQRYHLLGAQRHARIMGVFVRLAQRDSKPRYLSFLPRVARQFETALEAAGLTGIRDCLDRHLPSWRAGAERLAERGL
ncbi:aminoglycoside phosphotransferase family protein [Pseudaestuariivita atlantica]|uniref:Aminoglycoside phosphotransferase n=1 Tax=Pseudaestuariivita atlantica TaxID=1317121 RepID=A0A0L1JSU7_9RHOB|nr:phosphotransferase [Pseudaestuariivita atlantica]KNG94443.1 aminoglycoside phosphotransferase [Pseudaestuariivita atlantica]